MAWKWFRRSFRLSSPSTARKRQSRSLLLERLEERVVPNSTSALISVLPIRLNTPASLGASLAPADPGLGAVYQAQNTAPGFGGGGLAASNGTPGSTTPAGGHFVTPGSQQAMPNGELF